MNNKKYKRTLWGFLLTALFAIIFVVVVICIIPFVICNDLLFGPVRGWNYNYRIFANAFRFCYFFLGIQNKQYYEYDHDRTKKYVFVLNHISFFDIPEMLIGIKQPIRILAKRGPDKIPVFGYYYRKSTVMVDRSSNESRLKSIQLLRKYLDKGISILICPEGTFNMTNKPLKEFYDGAFKIAIDTQTNIKPVVILDTFDRLHYDYNLIDNGISRIVYLEEVSVQGLTGSDVPVLKEKVYKIMEDALIRYRATWIAPEFLTT
jgi:1-acyl-sn-glycerol-3-phosphate acyltransferase